MYRSTSSQNLEEQALSPSTKLLSSTSPDKKDTVVESGGRHGHLLRFSPTLFLLTFLVVMTTAGLGTTILFWFFAHAYHRGFTEIWREGAFLLDEGLQQNNGESGIARLTGLALASAAVCTCTVYISSVLTMRSL